MRAQESPIEHNNPSTTRGIGVARRAACHPRQASSSSSYLRPLLFLAGFWLAPPATSPRFGRAWASGAPYAAVTPMGSIATSVSCSVR
jgi:hypothetical protein